jgi:hypothetical protein
MGYKTHENAIYSQTHNERQKGYAVFFTNQGTAIQIAVPRGKSVNSKFYRRAVEEIFQ